MNKIEIRVGILMVMLISFGCHHAQKANSVEKPTSVALTAVAKKDTVALRPENSNKAILEKAEVPVLCYHRITDSRKGDYTVSTSTFLAHIKMLADSGYHSISPDQLYDYLVYNKPLPPKPVVISFDDSREEHAALAAPVLEKYGFRGVFFIMTITFNKKNYMTTEQIANLAKAGHTIGLHSWDHKMVTKYTEAADWQKEVEAPRAKLEKIIGAPVNYWAYPNGVYDHKGAAALSRYFKLSFTLFSKRDPDYPLQTVRRAIVPESSARALLKMMHRTFDKKKR